MKRDKFWGLCVRYLRRLFLWSPTRKEAVKRANGKCEQCSCEDKLNAHHKKPIDWEKVKRILYREIFVPEDELLVCCKKCHLKIHKENK